MAWAENEGNVVKQLGRSLNMIRQNIEQEDVEGLANHTRYLVACCAPYIEERKKYEISRSIQGDTELWDRCMEVIEDLLCEMSEKGIYAWKDEKPGDASALALGDDDG